MKDFLTTTDIAERLGVGIAQVQKLAKQGRLPHTRNGRRIIVPVPAWDAFIAQQSATALETLNGEVAHVK